MWERKPVLLIVLATCAIMVVAVAGFRLLLSSGLRQEFGALCALFVVFDVIGDLAIIQFWTFAGDLFNAREARRLAGELSDYLEFPVAEETEVR